MTNPLSPSRQPGLPRLSIQTYLFPTGPSPVSGALPALPGYGTYLANAFAWAGNPNLSIFVPIFIVWYEYDPAGAGAKLASATTMIGAPIRAGGDSATNSLALSAPDTNGVITATVGWNDGGNKTPHIRIEGVRLSDQGIGTV